MNARLEAEYQARLHEQRLRVRLLCPAGWLDESMGLARTIYKFTSVDMCRAVEMVADELQRGATIEDIRTMVAGFCAMKQVARAGGVR